jgi:hypothetical protein
MFFGMCNSPATFQSMMDHIFKDEIHNKWIIVYMDDILIFSKTKEGLEQITKGVLQKLRENDLYLKPHKCEFAKTKIEYLGMILEEGKVSMDPTKLIGIKQWPEPTTVKQVRSFLGFGNFYRRFIRNYSNVARPMNELLQKDKKFEWTTETQTAFDELKKRFTEEPVLIFPDTSKPFQIECDASKYASGAVLTQLDVNGDRHPCAFISKTFSPTERNYEIYDRELLSVIEHLMNGGTTSKDHPTKQPSSPTTRTSRTSGKHRNSIDDKHDGHSYCRNITSNWYTSLDQKCSSPTPYQEDRI